MKPRATVMKIGYSKFVFADVESAMMVYRALSNAIPVEHIYADLPDERKNIRYVRCQNTDVELTSADLKIMELSKTIDEMKAERDARADVDVDAEVRIDPLMIAAAPESEFDPF